MQALIGEIWIAQAEKHRDEDNQVVISIMRQLEIQKDLYLMIFKLGGDHPSKKTVFGLQRIYHEVNGIMTLYALIKGNNGYESCLITRDDFVASKIPDKFNTDTFVLTFYNADTFGLVFKERVTNYSKNDADHAPRLLDPCSTMQTLLGQLLIKTEHTYFPPLTEHDKKIEYMVFCTSIIDQIRKNKGNDPIIFKIDSGHSVEDVKKAIQWLHKDVDGLMALYVLEEDDTEFYRCHRITEYKKPVKGGDLFALQNARHPVPCLSGLRRESVDEQIN